MDETADCWVLDLDCAWLRSLLLVGSGRGRPARSSPKSGSDAPSESLAEAGAHDPAHLEPNCYERTPGKLPEEALQSRSAATQQDSELGHAQQLRRDPRREARRQRVIHLATARRIKSAPGEADPSPFSEPARAKD